MARPRRQPASSTEAPIRPAPGKPKGVASARVGVFAPQTPATRPVGQERAGPQAASGGLNVGFLNALGMARDIFFGKPSTKK